MDNRGKRRDTDGAYVQGFRILDWYFCSYVLFRGYVYHVFNFLRSDRIFYSFKLLKIVRTHVYLHLRCIFNCFLCWLYILVYFHDGTGRNTLIIKLGLSYKKSDGLLYRFFYFVFLLCQSLANVSIPLC